MPLPTSYIVPIPPDAQVGDIIVVGIYGPVVTTPSGWTVVAQSGVASLFSHTVASGDAGATVTFTFSTPAQCAAFIYVVRGSTGVTGAITLSAGAVSSLPFTVSVFLNGIGIAGCFSALSQTFSPTNLTLTPPFPITDISASGSGTNCPSVIAFKVASLQAITFTPGLVTSLAGWALHFAGTSPFVYYQGTHAESDIPPSSPAFVQQNTASNSTGAALPVSLTALGATETCIVCLIGAETDATGTTTVADNNSTPGVWTEVTGLPARNSTASFLVDLQYSIGHNSGATTVTVTPHTITPSALYAWVGTYSGVATASAVDTQNSVSNNNTTTPNTGLVTPTNSSDVIVGGFIDNSTVTGSISDYGTGGGSPNARTTVGVNGKLIPADQVITPNGTLTYGFQKTDASAPNSAGGIVALKALVSGMARPAKRRRSFQARAFKRRRPDRIQHYPISLPFEHVARAKPPLRFKPRPFRRKQLEHIQHYPVGFPFIRIARMYLKHKQVARVKAYRTKWFHIQHYPISLPFVRIARALKHRLIPLRAIYRTKRFHILHYPIGLPFVRLARALKHRLVSPRAVYRTKLIHILHYPISLPFIRIGRGLRDKRLAPPRIYRTKAGHVSHALIVVQVYRAARGVKKVSIIARRPAVRVRKAARWVRKAAAPVVTSLLNNPLIKSLGKMMSRQ